MKRLLLLLAFLALPTWAGAATYYVDCNANGDAGAGTGTGAAVAWKTVDKVNDSSFSAGDSILFNKGCTWRETLTVPSSGDVGNPITFGAYGSGANPIISGADIMVTWTAYGAGAGSTWQKATVTTEPNQVFVDGVEIVEGSGRDILNDHEWFWVGDVLYFRDDTGDPDGLGIVINASQRTYGVIASSRNYVTLDGLTITMTNESGIIQANAVTGTIIRNCTVSLNHNNGVNIFGGVSFAASNEDGLIDRCIAYGNGDNGILVGTYSRNWTISNNTVHHNSYGTSSWTSGIRLSVDPALATYGHIIEFNNVYKNGKLLADDSEIPGTYNGNGIHVDTAGDNGGLNPVKVRYNHVWDNKHTGLYAENTIGSQWYYNVSTGNEWGMVGNQSYPPAHINTSTGGYIKTDSTPSATYNFTDVDWYMEATIAADDYTPAANTRIVAKDTVAGNGRSWNFGLLTDGKLVLERFDDAGAYLGAFISTNATGITDGVRCIVGLKVDYNNGSGNTAVTFYVNGGSLGTITGTGLDHLNADGTAPLSIFGFADGTQQLDGKFYRLQFWSDLTKTTLIKDLNVYTLDQLDSTPPDYTQWIDSSSDAWTAQAGVTYTYPTPNKDNEWYNNTAYGNDYGVDNNGQYDGVPFQCIGNTVKNNIIIGSANREFTGQYGGGNDGLWGSGNVYLNNSFGAEYANFILFAGANKSTYDAWEAAYGGTTSSVEADPLFVSASDFRLQSGSPAINAGVDVSLTSDHWGYPVYGLPDIGAVESQGAAAALRFPLARFTSTTVGNVTVFDARH